MVYNELEQGDILSEVRIGLASIAYSDISLRSIKGIFKIRQDSRMMSGLCCLLEAGESGICERL